MTTAASTRITTWDQVLQIRTGDTVGKYTIETDDVVMTFLLGKTGRYTYNKNIDSLYFLLDKGYLWIPHDPSRIEKEKHRKLLEKIKYLNERYESRDRKRAVS